VNLVYFVPAEEDTSCTGVPEVLGSERPSGNHKCFFQAEV